jgi:signal transduction histidine kinase
MLARHSLRRRIIAAFVLMTGVVAGLFAVAMVITMDLTERNLATEFMQGQLEFVLGLDKVGTRMELGPNTRYLSDRDPAWSDWLSSMPDGFNDAYKHGAEVHVFIQTRSDGRHVLLASLDEFERREEIMERFALLGFIASVALALVLGVLTANRVIAPVVRLSRQVRRRDHLLSLAPPLAPDYADDEVGRLAAAFDDTLGRLRDALSRERLFTSDISHEIRTPLMVIASSCELVRARGPLDPTLERQLDRIERAAHEMRELTDTLLRLAREPSPNDSVNSIGLQEAAKRQFERWQPEAVRRRLDLKLYGETGDQRYPAALLNTVMSNLLRNALHYTEQGFVAIELHPDGFSIIDSGVGIPSEERDRVFSPFFRGDKSRGDGVGIGLSLVQRICERQGWHLELRSPAHGGCEFRVELHNELGLSQNLHESPTSA